MATRDFYPIPTSVGKRVLTDPVWVITSGLDRSISVQNKGHPLSHFQETIYYFLVPSSLLNKIEVSSDLLPKSLMFSTFPHLCYILKRFH